MKRFWLLFTIALFACDKVEVKCKDEMCLTILEHRDSQLRSFTYIIKQLAP
jgi:hypothetical protein